MSRRRASGVESGYLDESVRCPPPLDALRELKSKPFYNVYDI